MPDDLAHLHDEFTRELATQAEPSVQWVVMRDGKHACVTCGHGEAHHWWSLDGAGCAVFDVPAGGTCACTRFVQHVRLRWPRRLLSWVFRRRIPRARALG